MSKYWCWTVVWFQGICHRERRAVVWGVAQGQWQGDVYFNNASRDLLIHEISDFIRCLMAAIPPFGQVLQCKRILCLFSIWSARCSWYSSSSRFHLPPALPLAPTSNFSLLKTIKFVKCISVLNAQSWMWCKKLAIIASSRLCVVLPPQSLDKSSVFFCLFSLHALSCATEDKASETSLPHTFGGSKISQLCPTIFIHLIKINNLAFAPASFSEWSDDEIRWESKQDLNFSLQLFLYSSSSTQQFNVYNQGEHY